MIRIFIAVPVPQPVQYILHSIGRGIPDSRPVPEEQIHMTLRFIGEVEGSQFKDIKESLSDVNHPPFSMGIRGVGHFPPRGKPKVIWAGVTSQERLLTLRRTIEKQLSICGIPPENRKFAAHITLARLKETSLKRLGEFLSGNSFLELDEFPIQEFHLYSSKLTGKGAIHTLEQRYPLLQA
jgi:RNA 2',3'-cyclic 3'-phosphodiesterase